MKETGIIMSGDHPGKILEGRKTMTRRVIKPQPSIARYFQTHHPKQMPQYSKTNNYVPHPDGGWAEIGSKYGLSLCPYGQVGDRLWVRETWYSIEHPTDKYEEFVTYKATAHSHILKTVKWKPSIHMPRWASRTTLEITGLRPERLWAITEEDAKAEGLHEQSFTYFNDTRTARNCFAGLWDSLNAKRGYGWEVNPWVWVISFKEMPDG